MVRIAFKVGGQVMGTVLFFGGLTLDANETAQITFGEEAIGWQWVAMIGGILFMAFAAWTQISLYRAFTDHSKFRKVSVDLAP